MTHMFQQSHFPATRLIDARAWEFLDVCAADGIDARLVGGCVRDALLANQSNQSPPTQSSPLTHQDTSQPPPVDSQSSICATDIDIAIACPPLDIITFCKKHRLKCIPTGLAHGTLTILFKGLVLEVTSLRADVDTFGRHATVTFGASFSEDAHRRDFTMNALYVDHQRIMYDAFDGASDLTNRRVRFIGDPAARIAEDYLRLYRYFRFWGRFGKGRADISVLPNLNTLKDGLASLSIERIQSELFKILLLPWPGVILKSMQHYGLLTHIFGDVVDCAAGLNVLRRLVMLERFGHHLPCPIRRLCALTNGINVANLLKLSRVQTKKLNMLSSKTSLSPKTPAICALTHPEWWIDAMLLHDSLVAPPMWTSRMQAKSLRLPPPFPLAGADIVAMGITGVRVGEILTDVKRYWIAHDFTPDHDACLAYARILI